MKRLSFLILTVLAMITGSRAADGIDSLSYAFGHQYTLASLAGENKLMQTQADFEDYIRGLEKNYRNPVQMEDSSYMMSYCLGGMEAVFIMDGTSHSKQKEMVPFPCIISGLRKVANGEIVLPDDTIAAMETINRYSAENKRPDDLDSDTQCRFFTAYGIMKAYQPGVQAYMEELKPGTECVEDRQAFAAGIADVLESGITTPQTAYEIGRLLALSVNLAALDGNEMDFPSFTAGAKAALGLGDQLIPREYMDEMIEFAYSRDNDIPDQADTKYNYEKTVDLLGQLDIEPFIRYRVDWSVTAGTVADEGSRGARPFRRLLKKYKISDKCIPGILMAQISDEDCRLYESISETLKDYPAAEGYKWFCGRRDGTDTTVGIMETASLFKANVHDATVDLDLTSCVCHVVWQFEEADSLKWAQFTGSNIGRYIAIGINGAFIFAPKVNSKIWSGSCSVTGLTPERINRLFLNAAPIDETEPVETVETDEAYHREGVRCQVQRQAQSNIERVMNHRKKYEEKL